MKIRFGTYTTVDDIDMRILGFRSEVPISEQDRKYGIFYPLELGFKEGYVRFSHDNEYYKEVSIADLKNAFFVQTKAVYKGYEFFVDSATEYFLGLRSFNPNFFIELGYSPYLPEDKKMIDKELYETKYFEVDNGFIIRVKCDSLDKLWEERTPSEFNLPMPEGMELVKEIEIPR